MSQDTLLLVDGSSYLYRAFHAMPDLRAVPGDPASAATGAIRGMINMMQSLRREVPATYVACVFDAKGPTFRDTLYPEYKAHRSPMPDDLRSQIEPIHEVVRLMGWTVLDVPGVEADDVIGTLAVTAARQGIEVIVSSGDKDLSQLVNEHITIIDTMNGKRRDVAGVTTEFGVPPALMVDYQTLVGDAVDNVPGVEKVGPKTAAKWLVEFGSLEALVARAGEIKGVAGENLRKALDWLPMARQLLTIKTDCDLNGYVPDLPSLQSLVWKDTDPEALKQFYLQYGFKSLAKALEEPSNVARGGTSAGTTPGPAATLWSGDLFDTPAVTSQAQGRDYTTVLDWATFDRWLERIRSSALTALDTETTSLDEMQAQIVGISLSVQPGEAAYIPLAHAGPDAPEQLPLSEVLERLRPWLEDPNAHKLGQHVKYDRHVLANHGIEVRGYVHDTMLQSYVLEVHRPHGLASLAERHVGRSGLSYEDLCGKGAHQISFSQVDVARATQYSCEDADMTLDVHGVLWPRLQADDRLRAVYE
ncbi:MAG: 5'-3' exonuclease H3TH domain-containing protein, partial [Limnohabitans sp.]